MAEKFGIENLKAVLKFGVTIGTSIAEDVKDKKFTLAEIFSLVPQFMQVSDFVAHKDDIINEAKDLSLDEISELVKDVEGVFNSEKITATIEYALSIAVSVKGLIELYKPSATTTLA